jgi:hypothetical protein
LWIGRFGVVEREVFHTTFPKPLGVRGKELPKFRCADA